MIGLDRNRVWRKLADGAVVRLNTVPPDFDAVGPVDQVEAVVLEEEVSGGLAGLSGTTWVLHREEWTSHRKLVLVLAQARVQHSFFSEELQAMCSVVSDKVSGKVHSKSSQGLRPIMPALTHTRS